MPQVSKVEPFGWKHEAQLVYSRDQLTGTIDFKKSDHWSLSVTMVRSRTTNRKRHPTNKLALMPSPWLKNNHWFHHGFDERCWWNESYNGRYWHVQADQTKIQPSFPKSIRIFHKSQNSTSSHWHFFNLTHPFHAVFRCSCGGSTLVDSHDFHRPPDTSDETPTSSKAEVWQVGLVCLLSVAFHGFTSEKKNMEKHQSSGNLVTEIDSQPRQNEGKTKWLQK